MCVAIIRILVDDVTNFEIELAFLVKPYSYMSKKYRYKNWNVIRTKRAF